MFYKLPLKVLLTLHIKMCISADRPYLHTTDQKFLKEMHANQLTRMSSLISPQSMCPTFLGKS